jgi:hypothetical protein
VRALSILVLVAATGACDGDLDPPWQLDHDRIVAVRATPPSIAPGEQARLDALIAVAGDLTVERGVEAALVASPASLADTLAFDGTAWTVTAPTEERLAAARTELGLAADAPVPLQLGVSFAGGSLLGTKIVWLGMARTNPSLTTMMVDGAPADGASELVVAPLADVPLSIEATIDDKVNWLTSCGTMHDFDLPQAYLRVEKEDPAEGQLAVVLRDKYGGVVWKLWPIRAE